MTLKEKLKSDMAEAMRQKNRMQRDTLRLLLAALKQHEVDEQITLDDAGVLEILTRQAKQRRESVAEYEKMGRAESAAQEKAELAVIELYLPAQMSADAIRTLAREVIAESGIDSMKGMGQLMSLLMPRLQGQADGRLVSQIVRELLV